MNEDEERKRSMQEDLSERLMHDVIARAMVRALSMYEDSHMVIMHEMADANGNMLRLAVCVMSEAMAHHMENALLVDVFNILIEEVFDVRGKEKEETINLFSEAMEAHKQNILAMWNDTGLKDEMIAHIREQLGK